MTLSLGITTDYKRLIGKIHRKRAREPEDLQCTLVISACAMRALVKGEWQLYRLPKASHAFEPGWQTEWMRIREIETEHYMMDIQGMFYELQPIAFEDHIWGVKPVYQHLRTIPDYCSFRGLLALGGNETTPNEDNNAVVGQAQSGIWFGESDDLWSWGRPQGWGGPWRNDLVTVGKPSDPFLFTDFRRKMLHLLSEKSGSVDIEVDFLGNGTWGNYDTVKLTTGEYHPIFLPDAFSAQWVRLVLSVPQNDRRIHVHIIGHRRVQKPMQFRR